MTPELAVAERIAELTAVTAMVGSRIYVGRVPQKPTTPYVFVQLVVEPMESHLRGEMRHMARVQVDVYAAEGSGLDAKGLCDALHLAVHGHGDGSGLSGWAGELGTPPFQVHGILPLERDSGFDPDELHLYRVRQDYRVLFRHAGAV